MVESNEIQHSVTSGEDAPAAVQTPDIRRQSAADSSQLTLPLTEHKTTCGTHEGLWCTCSAAFRPLDGAALRDEALDLLERTRGEWIEQALQYAHLHLQLDHGDQITADDIHEAFPIPAGIDPRVMGAVLNPRHFKLLGYRQSRRRVNHARRIAVWGAK